MAVIYGIYSQHHGRIMYVGQTVNFQRRQVQHKGVAFRVSAVGYNYPLYCSIRKYGWANFRFDILESVEPEQLNEKEEQYIAHFDTYYNGYNLTRGGSYTSSSYSEEVLLAVVEQIKNTNKLFVEISEEFGISQSSISCLNRGLHPFTAKMQTPLRKHWNYRLPPDKVKRIQEMLKKGIFQKDISIIENVAPGVISHINRGYSYFNKDLKYPLNSLGNELSEEELERIFSLLEGKQTMREIGEECGISEKSVSQINLGKAYKRDRKYPIRAFHLSPSFAEEVKVDLANESLSISDIATKYGKTKGVIYNINCGKTFFSTETNYPIRHL